MAMIFCLSAYLSSAIPGQKPQAVLSVVYSVIGRGILDGVWLQEEEQIAEMYRGLRGLGSGV
jgi:hypothetical protein